MKVTIVAVDNKGVAHVWLDQNDATKALKRGYIAAAQCLGFAPVYDATKELAAARAVKQAEAHMRRAKISGEPPLAEAYDLRVVTP